MLKNEKGYTLLFTIMCIVIITVLGVGLLTITKNGMMKNDKRNDIVQAEALATKGLDFLVAKINHEVKIQLQKTSDDYEEFKKKPENKGKQFPFAQKFDKRFVEILKGNQCVGDLDASLDGNTGDTAKYGYCVVLKYKSDGNLDLEDTTFSATNPEHWYTINKSEDGVKKNIVFKSIGSTDNKTTEKTLYVRKTIGIELRGSGEASEVKPEDGKPTEGGIVISDEQVRLQFAMSTFEGQSGSVYDNYYAKYPFTRNDNDNPKENGSIFLHGGVDVIGDVYVQNNLYVSEMGMPNYKQYENSRLPRFISYYEGDKEIPVPDGGAFALAKTKPGKIFLGAGIGSNRNKNGVYKSGLNLTRTIEKKGNTEIKEDADKYVARFKKYHLGYLINPSGMTLFKYDEAEGSLMNTELSLAVGPANETNKGVSIIRNENATVDNPLAASVKIEEKGEIIKQITGEKQEGNYCSNGTPSTSILVHKMYCSNSVTFNKGFNLELTKKPNAKDVVSREGVAYINGNLKINTRSTVNLKGTIYIKGDLEIDSANIVADTVLYVGGTVIMRNVKISGSGTAVNRGNLIIFSNGNIGIQGISSGQAKPSNLKAFFLSNNDIALTGSTSHMLINGGLSARSIELTAMRGEGSASYDQEGSGHLIKIQSGKSWVQSCNNVSDLTRCQDTANLYKAWENSNSSSDKEKLEKQMRSRLTVAYNPDVLITYQEYAIEELEYALVPTSELERALK